MSVFRRSIHIRDCDVAVNRALRPSCLFSMLQEASIDHTEQLGAGRSKTLDRGYLWVLARQNVMISRLPVYGEDVILESWPGEMMHILFPRYYRILDTSGECLLSASAIWSLISAETRNIVFPEIAGIKVPGTVTGNEIPLPSGIRRQETTVSREFTVPYSYTDINGHMNNIRYLDEAENMIPEFAGRLSLREIAVDYSHEICRGERMAISLGISDSCCYFSGDGERHYFSVLLKYNNDF